MRALRTIALVITVLLVVIACSAPAQLILLSNDGEFIDYSGTATLSGTYFLDLSNLEIQDLVCFHPDEPSQKLLPTRPDLNHPHWMCFSNSAEARKLFGLTSPRRTDSDCYKGYAKLTVRNYRRYIAESEGVMPVAGVTVAAPAGLGDAVLALAMLLIILFRPEGIAAGRELTWPFGGRRAEPQSVKRGETP